MPQPRVARIERTRGGDLLPVMFAHAVPLWEEAVAAYLRDCRRRNLSPTTIEQYRWCLETGNRVRIWRADYTIMTLGELTANTLRQLEIDLLDAGVKPSTVATIHRRISTFGAWCEKAYGVGGDVRNVEAPLEPQRDPEVYSDAQVVRILAACTNERDRLIVRMLLHTGLRAAELCNLDCDDIVVGPDGAWLHVRQGKGRKDRIVPLDSPDCRLSDLLTTYIKRHRPPSRSRRLLLSLTRDASGDHPPLAKAGLQSMLERLGDATGLHVHAHAFRHTFATRAVASGVNALILQRVLGHTTLRMVSRYVHSSPVDLLAAWANRRAGELPS